MRIICLHCGRPFEGKHTKFCSQDCMDSHIVAIEKRVMEAVEDDPSHIKKLCNDV